ncbi:MAG: class I adenylate-forming enzyme family protein, partial [Burkholderiaceae bacterium]
MSFWRALEQGAERWPDQLFLTGSLGGDLSRAQLLQRAARGTAALRDWGVRRGDRVALTAAPSPELVTLQWALSAVGAIQVPLNPVLRGPLRLDLLRDTSPRLVAVDAAGYAALIEDLRALPDAPAILLLGEAGAVMPPPAHEWREAMAFEPRVAEAMAEHEPLAILFTSGTTGRSKGVLLSHRWGVDYCRRATHAMGIEEGDRHYGFLPQFHIAGQYAHVASAALAGASVALCEPFRADDFWSQTAKWQCTAAVLLSSMAGVLRQASAPRRSSLRKLHIVPLPPDFKELAARLDCRISTNYGSTEASVALINRQPRDHRSCGVLADGYEARIVDEWDDELPDGTAGELVLRPARPWTVMSEYWGRPEATNAVWRNGWLHTGDVFVRRHDGQFEFIDRGKDAIRRKGENISSYEVEMLACLHPQVDECAAVGIDAGDGEQELAVFYSCRTGPAVSEPAMLRHLQAVAPRFRVPRFLRQMPSLPRTQTG